MPDLSGLQSPGWKFLRVKANSAGAGTFADDTDYARAPGTELAGSLSKPIPRDRLDGGGNTVKVWIGVQMYDANGAPVDRGATACTYDITVVEQFDRPSDPTPGATMARPGVVTQEGEPVNATLNRAELVEMRGHAKRFAVRLSNFANIPATAVTAEVYYAEA